MDRRPRRSENRIDEDQATGCRRDLLAATCVRALVAGARSAGTRQQVRAAARRFVARHRRDDGYLRWVLNSASAGSALAVALLGLAAEPAGAEPAPFAAQTGAANPFNGQDVGSRSAPSLGDLDGDGDRDLVVGELDGILNYYENTGDAESPVFVLHTGAANPLNGQDVGARSAPALGDLDGDGDLDLLVGQSGHFDYFENTGDATAALFATAVANPFGLAGVPYSSAPTFGDLDGDGDLDLVAGEYYGSFSYFENTGGATSPAFVERTGAANALAGVDVGYFSTSSLGDLDGDGDLDLVAGELYGLLFFFQNTGNAASPAFVALTGAADPLAGVDVGYFSTASLGDVDGDGDLDLVAGKGDGFLNSFEHLGGRMVSRTGAANPLTFPNVASNSRPSLGDLDGDGDLDLVAGETFGTFGYFENTGSAASPAFIGAADPLAGQDVGLESAPALGDLDGDSDLDLIAGNNAGLFSYFENTGSATSPAFLLRTGGANPLNGEDVGFRSAPALGDGDGDGDLDLVTGTGAGDFLYYENTGTATSPAFALRTGSANPLDGQDVGDGPFALDSSPALADLDRDGDLDVVAGSNYGHFLYFENTGSATSPAFIARTGASNPLDRQDVGYDSAPALGNLDGDCDLDLVAGEDDGVFNYFESFVPQLTSASERTGAANPLLGHDVGTFSTSSLGDLDRDGDLDLIAGERYGAFLYFENTGSALLPQYAARTGGLNPMNGQNAGARAKPTLGDLDGDGDLDLVTGNGAGDFLYYENTGTATSAAFIVRTGSANPLDGQDVGDGPFALDSSPVLADLDRDGDLDVVAGSLYGIFFYFENTGTAVNAAFVERTGSANPLSSFALAGLYSTPAFGDVDDDGDLDLFSGNEYGTFSYFQNEGTATDVVFVALTGAANPLDGFDVGTDSSPTMGDLDGDGDVDVATGREVGTFAVHYFPEPAHPWLLGAGAALLSLLAGLRRRAIGPRTAE